jgi:hypothetical protein
VGQGRDYHNYLAPSGPWQPDFRVIVMMANSGCRLLPAIENPLDARKLSKFRKTKQDHPLLPCRSVLYESRRLFARVPFTMNVTNSLFNSESESECDDHMQSKLSNFCEFCEYKLSNFFEFSVKDVQQL